MIAWIPSLVFLLLYMSRFRDFVQQLPSRLQNPATVQSSSLSPTSNSDKYSELEKLKKLLDGGVLSNEEFEQEKRRILEGGK